ncbi:CCA tRNA nucleotidyltransferase [Zwartia sp.]|uniref:CCA tRNA nucleotidyltransferase n=1 Tax=Zwartia sp. TaxID=2978004 RepID=UPI002723C304|nr:CCA tRNA nucleotidyltransferase [Zwartia sp.]MDO9025694.1 CCA tRNA nucleotidyltransferase [Zwartia sp.]
MTSDVALSGLQVFIVGGAVRDALLGQPAGDRDWVVVGATPEEMVRRGFIPVGGDYPVFLHPETKEEYALARTERKSGRGYKGFTFYTGIDVTLEEDLKRRDLTVNAMAQSAEGVLIDPLNGAADLQARIFRHVGPAFEEDPVRILRLARFCARFGEFSVASETLALCRKMVSVGEVDALVPERVWQELARGLMSQQPARMLAVLVDTGAAARIMPEWQHSVRVAQFLDAAAQTSLSLASRYALLCLDTDARIELSKRLRSPTECADMARLLPRVLSTIHATQAEDVLSLFESCDALRKPERMLALIETAKIVVDFDQSRWSTCLEVVLSVDAGAAARTADAPAQIKQAVRAARLSALLVKLP